MKDEGLIQVQIERYLDGQMTEAETHTFDQALQSDQALQTAVDDELLLRAAMQRLREQDLRSKLKEWRKNTPESSSNTGSTSQNRMNWPIVLALLALSLLVFYIYRSRLEAGIVQPPPNDPSGEIANLSEANNQKSIPLPQENKEAPITEKPQPEVRKLPKNNPEDAMANKLALIRELLYDPSGYLRRPQMVQRSISPADTLTILSLKAQAASALEKNNFKAALRWLEKIDSSDLVTRQMTAHALFGAARYDEAAESFRSLSKSGSAGLDARWNLAMCYFAQYPKRQREYHLEMEQMLQGNSPSLRDKAMKWQATVKAKMPEMQ
jgi:hypothetical protein